MSKSETTTNTRTFKNYINGKWVSSVSERIFEHRNPARLSKVTGLFPLSLPEDTNRAITAAQEAFPAWRATPPDKRIEILKKALIGMGEKREEFARILTIENGKTLAESQAEIDSAIKEMDFQIAEGLRTCGETVPVNVSGVLAYSIREPLSVVGIISPWNFPVNVPSRKCTPALVAGNTCVFKPASLTPQTGLRFGLSSSIFTNDLNRALTFLEQTKVGITHVNLMTAFKEPQLSFGGIKKSGFGIPEAGKTGIEFFTEHKVAYIKYC